MSALSPKAVIVIRKLTCLPFHDSVSARSQHPHRTPRAHRFQQRASDLDGSREEQSGGAGTCMIGVPMSANVSNSNPIGAGASVPV
jgi:hypothetical protein